MNRKFRTENFSTTFRRSEKINDYKVFGKYKMRSKSREELDDLYKTHALKVKNKYDELLKRKTKNTNLEYDRYLELKRCEVCRDFENDTALLLCEYCDDSYHIYCLNPQLFDVPETDFVCMKCKKSKRDKDKDKRKQTKIKFEKNTILNQKKCHQCKLEISSIRSKSLGNEKNKNETILIVDNMKTCFKCKKDFHNNCFRVLSKEKVSKNKTNKNTKIICDICEKAILNKMKSTKISDYFKPSKILNFNFIDNKNKKDKSDTSSQISTNSFNSFDIKFTKDIKPSCQEAKFKLPKPLHKDQKKILEESLFRALQVKNIIFDDNLSYPHENCPENFNMSSREIGIQRISEYNKQLYYKFKEKTQKAEYPAIEIIDDDLQGFIVRANDTIPDLTLICEYTGDVTLARDKIFDNNDSIMDLIRAPSSSDSLVICPEKKGNIARFISGINNYNKSGEKKQNVNSIRYDIDGTVHVLLYASKCIKKNEILYYDYNSGGHDGYPTHYFQ